MQVINATTHALFNVPKTSKPPLPTARWYDAAQCVDGAKLLRSGRRIVCHLHPARRAGPRASGMAIFKESVCANEAV
jgi:hypothetical protein